MKKWLALILAVTMMLCCLTGCGSESEKDTEPTPTEAPKEAIKWMPYELTFGMTYDEAKAANSAMPEISVQENGSHFSKRQDVEAEFLKGYYGAPEDRNEKLFWLMREPAFYYSFNQDKELYEFYVMIKVFSEDDAESVYSHLKSYYTDMVKAEATTTEYSDAVKAAWKKDGVSVELVKEAELISVILHDFNNDLNSK